MESVRIACTNISSKRLVKPEWKKASRKDLMDSLGVAVGIAIYYGLKNQKDTTVCQTRIRASLINELNVRNIKSASPSVNLVVHFDYKNLTISQIIAGLID